VRTNTGVFIGTVMAATRKEAREKATRELSKELGPGETIGRVQAA